MDTTASQILLKPERAENETVEQYRERRKFVKFSIKEHMKGKLLWDSPKLGTFRHDDTTFRQSQGPQTSAND